MIKYTQFGKNSASFLAGITHNSAVSVEFIEALLNNYKFDFYLIELNKDNYYFIKKNNFRLSEFYPIIKTIKKEKLKLIDMSIEREIDLFSDYGTKRNKLIDNFMLFDDHVHYNLLKFLYYKIRNFFPEEEEVKQHLLQTNQGNNILNTVHEIHIKRRDQYMIDQIKNYAPRLNILIVVGINHFSEIETKLDEK